VSLSARLWKKWDDYWGWAMLHGLLLSKHTGYVIITTATYITTWTLQQATALLSWLRTIQEGHASLAPQCRVSLGLILDTCRYVCGYVFSPLGHMLFISLSIVG